MKFNILKMIAPLTNRKERLGYEKFLKSEKRRVQRVPQPKRKTVQLTQNSNMNLFGALRSMIGETPWQWLYDQLKKVFDTHLPLVDMDGDDFSVLDTFRGASWR